MAEAPVRCLKCGLLLAGRSLEGLCAACLLESSLEPDPEPEEPSVDLEWLNRRGLGTSRQTTVTGRRFGEYELEGEVARGGMGIIYRARHLRLNRVVALKMILPGPLATPDFLRRFQTEARAAATLDHPNVVSIHEVGEVSGQPYYTMRLVEGADLAQAIQREGALPPRKAAQIIAQVARAVHYAHQRGVLHRDLKPANIVLDGEGRPHVTDFGLAKLVEEDQGLTLSSASLGTPSYMSPEQAAGHARDVTTAADIYSLGAILFEALTGERLFAAPTPLGTIKQVLEQEARPASSVNRSVPPDLDTICLKCLEKAPHRRYRTALELAEDLEHWLAGEPIRARPVRLVERTWLWCRRRPALAGLAGASLAVLLLGVTVSTWQAIVATRAKKVAEERAEETLRQKAVTDAINEWMRVDVLSLVDTWGSRQAGNKANILLRDALIASTENLPVRFKDQPMIETEVRYFVGMSLWAIEQFQAAEDNLRRTYELFRDHRGPSHTNTLAAQVQLGALMVRRHLRGEVGEAVKTDGLKLMEDAYYSSMQNAGAHYSQMAAWTASVLGRLHMELGNMKHADRWSSLAAAMVGPLPRREDSPYTELVTFDTHQLLVLVRIRQGAFAEAAQRLQKIWWAEMYTRTNVNGRPQPDPRLAILHRDVALLEHQWHRNEAKAEELLTNGLAMSHEVVGSGIPTDSLVSTLFLLYLDQDRFVDALELVRAELRSAVAQFGVGHLFAQNHRERAIRSLGDQGDWQGVLDEFERQESLGLRERNDRDWHYRALALHLLGRRKDCSEARQALWQRFHTEPAQFERTRAPSVAITMLALPCPTNEQSDLLALADLGIQNVDTNSWWRSLRMVLSGMRAYRNGDHELAARILPVAAYCYPWLSDQPLAGYFLAMAEHRLGHAEVSRRTLEHANRWLDGIVRRGKLATERFGADRRGKLAPTGISGFEFGILIALRGEAEELILGRMVSPPVTPAELALNRQSWRPIQKQLDDASWLARKRDYRNAANHYAQARRQPGFSMEAAECESDSFWEMLLAHVLLGEAEAIEDLISQVFPDDRPVAPSILAFTLQLTNTLPAGLHVAVDQSVRMLGLEEKWANGEAMPAWWDKLALGLYWYRKGEYANAVGPLDKLTAEPYVHLATIAKAYLALTRHRMGDHAAARRLYDVAQTTFHQTYVEPSPELYQPFWVWAAAVEQAVIEAGQTIDFDSNSSK